jgi:DNA-binding response OmpR family regulator
VDITFVSRKRIEMEQRSEAMKILVAEDEADIRNLLKIHLEANGYHVFACSNGLEALDIFEKHDIQLAVLDVMMPVLDGYQVLKRLRETSDIPILFLTARDQDMDKVLGLGLGADDYLTKPFSMAELLARIGAHLRRHQRYVGSPEQNPVITYGDLKIDKDSCTVYMSEKSIPLNGKEFKLLLHFMENPERVFTKQQLYAAAWDDDYYFDDNTVMVHISHLRNKLEADPQNPKYIQTVRGIGYKLHRTENMV